MNDELWRNKLGGHFADYGQPEPPGLWEGIERAMAAKRQPGPLHRRGRVLRRVGLTGAAAAVIAAMLWVGRIAFFREPTETGTTTGTMAGTTTGATTGTTTGAMAENPPQTALPTSGPENVGPAGQVGATPAVSPEPASPAKSERPPLPGSGLRAMVSSDAESPTVPPLRDSIAVGASGSSRDEKPEPAKQTSPEKRPPTTQHYGNEDFLALLEPAKPRGSRKSSWSARIVASGVPGSGSKSVHGGYGALTSSSVMQSDIPVNANFGDGAMTDIMLLNRDSRTYTDTRHNPPIRAGVILSYALTDRLSVESGVKYTYLGARLRSGSEQHYYETRQSLHYLGIPANLNWSLWRNHRWNVYISGGGMVEHNISGSATTEYTDGERTFSRESRRVRAGGLQWSANASAGLQMDFSQKVGIFAAPGISYHFDNGSPIETAYKENPLNFDLTFGLRFSFD